jgi:hypothetical protein
MNDCQYFSQRSDCLEFSVEQAFQPDCQPAIRAWLTDAKTAQAQKEALLQALLDFDDDCGGFYRVRSFLLAAEYLALCPDCRQGDLIVDRLLKLSYGYFRVEKADWCMPPEAFVRSARETLARSDLGRVVPRFEAVIQQTESRAVMRHAARELLRIQPGNRCGIAAIAFDKLTRSSTIYGFAPDSLSRKCWQALIETPIWSNELAQIITQLILRGYRLHERCEILSKLIQLEPTHPLILPELIDLIDGWGTPYAYDASEEFIAAQKEVDQLLYFATQANPELILYFNEQLENLRHCQSNQDGLPLQALRVLSSAADGNSLAAQTLASLLEHFDDESWSSHAFAQVMITLGNLNVRHPEIIHAIDNILNKTKNRWEKYFAAIALLKLGAKHEEAITFLFDEIQEFSDNDFTLFVGCPTDNTSRWDNYYAGLLELEETQEKATETLKIMSNNNRHYHIAVKLLSQINSCKTNEIQTLLNQMRQGSENMDRLQTYHLLKVLREIGVGHPEVVCEIEHFIQTELDPQFLCLGSDTLLHLDPGNTVAVTTLNKILAMANSQEESLSMDTWNKFFCKAIGLLVSHTPNSEGLSKSLLEYLDRIEDGNAENVINYLSQMNQGSCSLLHKMLEKLQEEYLPGVYTPIVDWLEVFPDDELAKVVTTLHDQLTHPSDELHHTYHAIVWQCAQRLPRATFHQSWQLDRRRS